MSYDDFKTRTPDDEPPTEPCTGDVCEHCFDEDATTTFDQGSDFAYWTGQPRLLLVCEGCKSHLENAEPPERTFDDQLAASLAPAELMAHARKLK